MADKALEQIKDRSYRTELEERGVSNIVCYGIAFSGKEACVRTSR